MFEEISPEDAAKLDPSDPKNQKTVHQMATPTVTEVIPEHDGAFGMVVWDRKAQAWKLWAYTDQDATKLAACKMGILKQEICARGASPSSHSSVLYLLAAMRLLEDQILECFQRIKGIHRKN